jgi:DNA/RNA non-specific endonuclease/Pretoxin HINT domain
LSRDLTTNQNVLQKVVRTFTKKASKLVRLITNRDTIFATPEHPFYAVDDAPDGSNQGNWVIAGSLKKGIKVLLASGMLASVESAFAFDTTVTVYNFEVEKTHNYFVGIEGVLVHNACTLDDFIFAYRLSDAQAAAKVAAFESKLGSRLADFSKKLDNIVGKKGLDNTQYKSLINAIANDEVFDINGSCIRRLLDDKDDFTGFVNLIRNKSGRFKAALNGEAVNPILNQKRLLPNVTYDLGDYIYETDYLGRVKRVTSRLREDMIKPRDVSTNVKSRVNEVGGEMNAITDDDAGHIIAAQFFGPKERINFVPMRRELNQNRTIDGAWYKMEKEWRDNLNLRQSGYTVNVSVEFVYASGSSSFRPNNFIIKYNSPNLSEKIEAFTN